MKSVEPEWMIVEEAYRPERELYWETIFALSNGYMAARGTLEENHHCPSITSYFGAYVAGIFDKYYADYQAIVNLPDFFNTVVCVDGEIVDMTKGTISGYRRALDMYNGVLTRSFTWTGSSGTSIRFEIERFISKAQKHLAVQRYRLEPLNRDGNVEFISELDGGVANIDFHASGYQLCKEKYVFIADEQEMGATTDGGYLVVRTRTTRHTVREEFAARLVDAAGRTVPAEQCVKTSRHRCVGTMSFPIQKGQVYQCEKYTAVYTSNDRVDDLAVETARTLREALEAGYERLRDAHSGEWRRAWKGADVQITGSERDQRNVRFNIFHLIQMGNPQNPYVNIGSRGLTSEMHYGNCFWDTEIFILPFFVYTQPDAARALVQYRYLTLPEAREKARRLLFKGAMFPWMSSYPGKEQADYWEYANIAVHIVSDVIIGLMHYCQATGDEAFMLDHGLELLVETARFWQSRVSYSDRRRAYVLNVVKGPNEYAIANNNTYTNWNARWNLRQAADQVEWAKCRHPDRWAKLAQKLEFQDAEIADWRTIAERMYIAYDAENDLYIEDDSLPDKSPVDLKKLKPGKKITTELGYTWDTFLRLKIVKQADVLLLMTLHPEDFTDAQLRAAWDFYEPITLHDSSLSYNTHCIVANQLGFGEKRDRYFEQTSRLDLEDEMENVFLGIHSANAGGTWQCVVNGYAGMRLKGDALEFHPRLPDHWQALEFRVFFRGNLYRIRIENNTARIEALETDGQDCRIEGNRIVALQKEYASCN